LAIEAALIAINKPPGLIRANFGFMHVRGFDPASFLTVKEELAAQVLLQTESTIIATDNDRRALDSAKQNAKTAGVEHLIQFTQCEFEETPVPPGRGIFIVNPPYGERLGASDELKNAYAALGNFLKKCAGYFGYIFTASQDLAKCVGLKPSAKKDFLNGSLECKLLEYEMFEGNRKEFKTELSKRKYET
jgi:putative N6-adenine-specific DNA methylase